MVVGDLERVAQLDYNQFLYSFPQRATRSFALSPDLDSQLRKKFRANTKTNAPVAKGMVAMRTQPVLSGRLHKGRFPVTYLEVDRVFFHASKSKQPAERSHN